MEETLLIKTKKFAHAFGNIENAISTRRLISPVIDVTSEINL